MGTLDIILLVCFLPAVIAGISKGFIKQAIGLLSLLVGAWAAFHFSSPLSIWLTQYFTLEKSVLHIISFVAIALLAIILLNILGSLLSNLVKNISLGWFNRLLGVLLGIFTTALVLGLLSNAFEGLNEKWELVNPAKYENSTVYSWLRDFSQKIFPFLKSFITGIPDA